MEYQDLTNEQKAKARACKNADELVALAKAEGVELTDDQLDAIAGGALWRCSDKCPKLVPGSLGNS